MIGYYPWETTLFWWPANEISWEDRPLKLVEFICYIVESKSWIIWLSRLSYSRNSSLELQIKSSLLWKFSLEIEGGQTGVRLSARLYYMYTLLPALSHMDLCQRYAARTLIYALKSFWKASFTWVVQWHRLVILPVVTRLHKKIFMLLWLVNAYCYFPNFISELTFNMIMKYFEWSILHLHN